MDTQIAYGLLSLIQERAARVLDEGEKNIGRFAALSVAGKLRDQLRDPKTMAPDGLSVDVGGLLDRLDVFDVVDSGDAAGLRDRLRARVSALGKSLLEGDGLQATRAAVEKLVAGAMLPGDGPPAVVALLRRQLGIGISFITTLKNLADLELAREIPEGWRAYFFGEGGFETVDGIAIVSPGHIAFKERSGEQYVRDLVRITAEVAGDRRYSLRSRHAAMLDGLADRDKAARWFKGAASMAESLVTSAVEEVCLGVATFQTNAILAASAATYAGTVARKATQHAFLAELAL